MADTFDAELTAKLENQFPEDKAVISDVVNQVQEARQYDYTDHLGLDDVESVVTGIENWSQDQGVIAGWNRWIGVGVPDTDTSHLTV